MTTQYRQGDVFIEQVESIPADAKPAEPRRGRFILAEGEATGHAHAVIAADNIEMFERDGRLWLRVAESTATVRHEEHGPITLEPGDYEVSRQREYSPEAVRYVRD